MVGVRLHAYHCGFILHMQCRRELLWSWEFDGVVCTCMYDTLVIDALVTTCTRLTVMQCLCQCVDTTHGVVALKARRIQGPCYQSDPVIK